MKFAIIDTRTNLVENVIVADSLEDAQNLGFAVELTDNNICGPGWFYNPDTGKFFENTEVNNA